MSYFSPPASIVHEYAAPRLPSITPDVLLAVVIEAVAENLPGDDADVIELRRDEARDSEQEAADSDDD